LRFGADRFLLSVFYIPAHLGGQMADPEEKCGCCSGGIINPETGFCNMCGRPAGEENALAKVKSKPKTVKRPHNGHGDRHQRQRCCPR